MAEDLAPRISSLLTDLGPNPQQNIHSIVSKTCELLSCGAAVYACFEAGSDTLCIRSACNLPHHPVQARSPIHELFREVIVNGGEGPVCAVDPAVGNNKSGAAAGPWLAFQSFIGQQVLLGGLSPGALAALDMRRRDFTDPERLLIGLAARALALEEGRLQREQALQRRILDRTIDEPTNKNTDSGWIYVGANACEADFDGNQSINFADLAKIRTEFGRTDCNQPGKLCYGDINGDGAVNFSDLAITRSEFGRTDCPSLP